MRRKSTGRRYGVWKSKSEQWNQWLKEKRMSGDGWRRVSSSPLRLQSAKVTDVIGIRSQISHANTTFLRPSSRNRRDSVIFEFAGIETLEGQFIHKLQHHIREHPLFPYRGVLSICSIRMVGGVCSPGAGAMRDVRDIENSRLGRKPLVESKECTA